MPYAYRVTIKKGRSFLTVLVEKPWSRKEESRKFLTIISENGRGGWGGVSTGVCLTKAKWEQIKLDKLNRSYSNKFRYPNKFIGANDKKVVLNHLELAWNANCLSHYIQQGWKIVHKTNLTLIKEYLGVSVKREYPERKDAQPGSGTNPDSDVHGGDNKDDKERLQCETSPQEVESKNPNEKNEGNGSKGEKSKDTKKGDDPKKSDTENTKDLKAAEKEDPKKSGKKKAKRGSRGGRKKSKKPSTKPSTKANKAEGKGSGSSMGASKKFYLNGAAHLPKCSSAAKTLSGGIGNDESKLGVDMIGFVRALKLGIDPMPYLASEVKAKKKFRILISPDISQSCASSIEPARAIAAGLKVNPDLDVIVWENFNGSFAVDKKSYPYFDPKYLGFCADNLDLPTSKESAIKLLQEVDIIFYIGDHDVYFGGAAENLCSILRIMEDKSYKFNGKLVCTDTKDSAKRGTIRQVASPRNWGSRCIYFTGISLNKGISHMDTQFAEVIYEVKKFL